MRNISFYLAANMYGAAVELSEGRRQRVPAKLMAKWQQHFSPYHVDPVLAGKDVFGQPVVLGRDLGSGLHTFVDKFPIDLPDPEAIPNKVVKLHPAVKPGMQVHTSSRDIANRLYYDLNPDTAQGKDNLERFRAWHEASKGGEPSTPVPPLVPHPESPYFQTRSQEQSRYAKAISGADKVMAVKPKKPVVKSTARAVRAESVALPKLHGCSRAVVSFEEQMYKDIINLARVLGEDIFLVRDEDPQFLAENFHNKPEMHGGEIYIPHKATGLLVKGKLYGVKAGGHPVYGPAEHPHERGYYDRESLQRWHDTVHSAKDQGHKVDPREKPAPVITGEHPERRASFLAMKDVAHKMGTAVKQGVSAVKSALSKKHPEEEEQEEAVGPEASEEVQDESRKPKLGTGTRFKHLVHKLAGQGDIEHAKALAAVIGRKAHGAKTMAKLAAKGKKG